MRRSHLSSLSVLLLSSMSQMADAVRSTLLVNSVSQVADSVRMKQSSLVHSSDLCDRWLMVKYMGINETADAPISGSLYLLEGKWRDVPLFRKSASNGCVKTYVAKCEMGGIEVTKTCPGRSADVRVRCLGGFGCFVSSRKSDIAHDEEVDFLAPEANGVHLPNGVVKFSSMRAGKCPPVTTQANFDLNQYISKPWYVQQQMVTEYLPVTWNYCMAAKYTMQDKATFWGYMVQVRNVAREKDGTVHDSGSLLCAYSADKLDPAKLGVAPCFLPTALTGDYWVLAYDEDEGYAVVSGGQPTTESPNGCTTGEGTNDAGLWLFTRQRERNNTIVHKMREILGEKGFDLDVLNNVDHAECEGFPDSLFEEEEAKFCTTAVEGALIRNSAWRHSEKCKCPQGTFLDGDDPACWSNTGFDRYFKSEVMAGKGCICAEKESTVGQGEDGNPWGWDRHRRCDHTGYSPACGPCEGVGGIAWGDEKTDIKLASCEVVATKDELADTVLKRPVWGASWSRAGHEILIGIKTDPACFQSFPNSESTGPNCYKPQEVRAFSDIAKTKAIRIEANQAGNAWGVFGNVTSVIFHQGAHMWITNTLPLGITQTICASPREGGDSTKPAVYPVEYNWTDNLFFVAREKVDVEYGVGVTTMDHWAFGPHHAWTDPATGIIVRMWQPWNGLQIVEPGTWREGADPLLFSELSPDGTTAPVAAKKGGSTFRIKCDDNGFPTAAQGNDDQVPSVLELARHPAGESKASASDLRRARSKVPRSAYKGDEFQSMSETLNKWLVKHAPNSRECDSWAVEELQQLQVQLLALRDPKLDHVYQTSADNRRLTDDIAGLQKEWEQLNGVAAADPHLARMHRDGHCHEAVMWYVHHLPESTKDELKGKVALPLLSYMRHDLAKSSLASVSAQQVKRAYDYKVTCASCHSNHLPA